MSKILLKDQNQPENVKNIPEFLAFQRYLSKINSYVWDFWHMSQKYVKNKVENVQNMI